MPPVPAGRGRWRFVLCDRYGVDLAELVDAYSRNAVFDVSKPAQTTFVISGRSPQVPDIGELYTDLRAWRWNDNTGADDLMFRGRIGQTQDTLSADSHVVNVTALDYRAMLTRRVNPFWLFWTQVEQLQIAEDLIHHANTLNYYWTPPPFGTNADLGIRPAGRLNPDSSPLGAGAVTMLRDRVYVGGETVGSLIDDLSNCVNGFDWEIGADLGARFWYPQRGATITGWAAEYGSTVAALSRTVNSSAYANWIRVTGKAADPAVPPMSSTAYQAGLSDPVATPWGIWQSPGAYPDISDQTTLDQQAAGLLAADALLEPSYVLEATPGRWNPSDCWLGDTVRVIVNSGRLAVDNAFRLQTVAFDISDDGTETKAALTFGAAEPKWTDQNLDLSLRVDRLERR